MHEKHATGIQRAIKFERCAKVLMAQKMYSHDLYLAKIMKVGRSCEFPQHYGLEDASNSLLHL